MAIVESEDQQPDVVLVELRPKVHPETYVRIMTECARARKTQGEVIDRLAELLVANNE